MTLPPASRFFLSKVLCASAVLIFACSLQAEPASDLVQKGSLLDSKFQAKEALQYYLEAEQLEPSNADVKVRIARQYRHLMTDARSEADKVRLGALAVSYGRKAAALAPNDSDAQLSTAISYGKLLPLQGSKEQMESSKVIKAGAEKAIKLDPRNDLAWHIAGRWHRAMAEVGPLKRTLASIVYGKLPEATFQDASVCFEKAAKLNPDRLMHQIELGRTYAQMGRKDEARRLIQKGLSMPNREKDDPETKKRGQATLAQLR